MSEACQHLVRRKLNSGEYVDDACGKAAKFIVEREFSGLTSRVCGTHVPATRLRPLGVQVRPLSGTGRAKDEASAGADTLLLGRPS